MVQCSRDGRWSLPALIVTVPRTIKSCHDYVRDNEEYYYYFWKGIGMRVFRGKLISKNLTIQETPVALQNCVRKRHISFSSSVRSCCNISHSIYLTSTDQSIGEIKENFYLEHACALVTSVSLTVIESYRPNDYDGRRANVIDLTFIASATRRYRDYKSLRW